MASRQSSSRIGKNEQLKNLEEVFTFPNFSFSVCDEVHQFITKFLEKYQLQQKLKFRNDIGSVLEQLFGPPCLQTNYSRWYLFRLIFSLSTNSQLSVLLQVPSLSDFPPPCRISRECQKRYEREAQMYREVLPRMRAVWPKDGQPPFTCMCASTAQGTVLLEDSSEYDFHTKKFDSLLDLADAQAVMKSLGRFHATSTAIINADSLRAALDALIQKNVIGTFDGYGGKIMSFDALFAFHEQTLPHVGEGVRNTFENFRTNFERIIESYHQPSADELDVLVHGELCLKNILFYGVDQCQFINFQQSRRGSPVLDVMRFLMSSVRIEIVETECDALLSCYLEEFNKVAIPAGRQYHQETFQANVQAHKRYLFHDLLSIAQLWTDDSGEKWFHWDFAFEKVLRSDVFIRVLEHWMKFFQLEKD